MTLRDLVVERIRAQGPLTFAEFMELALYHPEHGYYARAPRRSGRAGDFFTSPDVGPVFGALVAEQIVDCWTHLGAPRHGFDLVEAGAGDGQLASDLLDALAVRSPACYRAVALHLVEPSAPARARHQATLGAHRARLVASSPHLPGAIRGVLFANELLDALPVHLVRGGPNGLEELYVDESDGRLVERAGPLSTPALAEYFHRLGLELAPGWRAEVNLAALDWMQSAARALARGFLILIDYGHEAAELYSPAHASGTLATYRRHVRAEADPLALAQPPWLEAPGTADLTADVDFTSVRRSGEAAGLTTLGLVDQTYFLLGLGAADLAGSDLADPTAALRRRLALKTLLLPGGLGSTHKVLIQAKGVDTPVLRGLAFSARMTP